MKINNVEYQEISEKIVSEIRENGVSVYEIMDKIKEHHNEKVAETIRWMIDNNILTTDDSGNLKKPS